MGDTQKWYDAHLEAFQKEAFIRSRAEYESLYRRSIDDPEGFWSEQAAEYLSWERPWDSVLRYDFDEANIEWFGGGRLNASVNCLDRHLESLRDKVAYFWEGDNPEERAAVTYGELHGRVERMAAVLKSRGIEKGDRVIIYMPMILELPGSPCWPAQELARSTA